MKKKELERLLQEYAKEPDIEHLIGVLRVRGFDRIDTIRFLKDHVGYSLAEAKKCVHFSDAWSDNKHRDEKFWDDLEKVL